MSKKCCEIIYNGNEKFCTRCGKPLVDVPEEEAPLVLDMSEVDKIAASVMGDAGGNTALSKEEPAAEETEDDSVTKEEQAEPDVDNPTVADDAANSPESDDGTADEDKASDDNDDNDDDDDEEDDGKASLGLKSLGTLMTIIMIAAIVAVGLGIYFVKLKPFYKEHNINDPVVYEGVATDTDVNNVELRPLLTPVSIEVQSPTDAVEDAARATDASDADETEDDNADSEEASEGEE